MKGTDILWELIMTYQIWDGRKDKPLCKDLEGFNKLNRIYKYVQKEEE